jgi:hypothetical protein
MKSLLERWPFKKILALDTEIEELMKQQKDERREIDERLNKIGAATLEGDWGSIITPRES